MQERAQRLLQVSSDEEEDINAYTATQRTERTPHVLELEGFLQNYNEDEDLPEEEQEGTTDVKLLKKCIELTNENRTLRSQIEKQQVEMR